MVGKIKAVLVECGGVSGAWLAPARKIKGLEIMGLVDLNEEIARKRKETFDLRNADTGNDLCASI